MTDSRFGPDHLDDLWDEFISNGGAGSSHRTSDTAQFLARLEQEAPMINSLQRDRIYKLVQFPASNEGSGGIVFLSPLAGGSTPVEIPSHPARMPRGHIAEHPVLQVAATILLLLGILSVWLVIRSGNTTERSLPGAAISSPMTEQSSTPPFLMSVVVPPAADPQNLLVFIRQIELAPGMRWEIPTEFQGGESFIVRRFLDTGTVLVKSSNGLRFTPTEDTPLDFSGNPTAIENTGNTNAAILELIVSTGETALPEPPSGSQVIHQSVMGYEVASGNGVTFVLARVAEPSDYQPGVNSSTHPVIQALVESGSYTFTPNDGTAWPGQSPASTPISGGTQTLNVGESLHSEPGHFPTMQAEGDGASLLLLGARTVTSADVAQGGTALVVPGSDGRTSVALLEITLPPGTDWTTTGLGSSQFWVKSGTVVFSNSASQTQHEQNAGTFFTASAANQTLAPTISNPGSEPAVVIQGTVFPAASFSSIDNIGTAHNATVRWLAFDTQNVPTWPGELTLNLRSLNDPGGASYSFQEIRIGTILNGEGGVVSLGGEVSVLQRPPLNLNVTPDLTPESLSLGNSVSVAKGSAIIMHPYSGLQIYSSADAGEILWLSFVSIPPTSEAAAAQALHDDIDSVMQVTSTDCTIQPRTVDQFADILANADASGTPRVGADRTGNTGTPADDVTIRAVASTLKQIVACNDSRTLLQRYSLYSENMLRFLGLNGSLTIDDIESAAEPTTSNFSGTSPIVGQIAVDEVELFPDGRAGALVNANGDIAYVTFVNEGGQWLIDYWDDSAPPATPVP